MGGKRSKRAVRCPRCRMHEGLCVCGRLPRVQTRSRWVVLQHPSERWRTTNTGWIVEEALSDVQRLDYVSRVEAPPIDLRGRRGYLLFPVEGAEPLPPEALGPPDEVAIVVLDGSWGQTRKMARWRPGFADLPVVGLPLGARPRVQLREHTVDGGMHTADAVAWLLGALEGEAAGAGMLAALRQVAGITLATRGTPLPDGPRYRAGQLLPPE